MNKANQLALRFQEVIFDGTFIAYTNYKQQLSSIHVALAEKKHGQLNTIAGLAQHIHYYINGVNKVLRGGSLDINDKYSFDFPIFDKQEHWEQFLNKFWADAQDFGTLISSLNDNQLAMHFVAEKYGSYQRNIDAMIEHCYYHLGQIVLIKKLSID